MRRFENKVGESALESRLDMLRPFVKRGRWAWPGLLGALMAAMLMLVLPQAAAADEVTEWEAGVYDYKTNFDAPWEFAPEAGSYPYIGRTFFSVAHGTQVREHLRTVKIELPAGLMINPQAVQACKREHFYYSDDGVTRCADDTQIGEVDIGGVPQPTTPVYRIEARRGAAAEFAFQLPGVPVYVQGKVASDGTAYAYIPNNSAGVRVASTDFRLYGIPKDRVPGTSNERIPAVITPTSCVGPVDSILNINFWRIPQFERHVSSTPVGGVGCAGLRFDPTTTALMDSSKAGDPTGLTFDLRVPQNDDPGGRATAHVKQVEVELPIGMRVNPSAADGLAGCTLTQMKLESTDQVACPPGSKIGSVKATTPLLEEEIGGSVYLAAPYENPFGSLLALYVVAEQPERGIRVKIPGEVEIDQATGQLTAKFMDNPQLPFDSLQVRLNGGPRAPLALPKECGTYQVVTRVSPWSAVDPENPTAAEIIEQSTPIVVNGDCAGSGFAPRFAAGSESSLAATSSPFVLNASREDREQEFASLDEIELPEGLLGYISRVETCEGAAADAGTCSAASRVGRVLNSIGAGPRPAWIPQAGKSPATVHLAGPYRGAPYSLSIVVPAQAGPFDLGRVVVRTPLNVNERTAQITTRVSESRVYNRAGALTQHIQGALPTQLEGIPLQIRDIRVIADREGFMVNPTSCQRQQVKSRAISVAGQNAALSSPFAVTGCRGLGFAPRFKARILDRGRRSTVRSWHPRTRFAVVPRKGDANIGAARVVLPSSIILDQANIGTTCTRAQMAARDCPARSVVGFAKAWSPVLNRPVRGPVYLAANGGVRPLPDLAAVLDGEVRLVLQGEISTRRGKRRARLENTFRVVPDAPVSRFVLTMRGGKNRGLLVNSTDLCRSGEKLNAVFTGQNGERQRIRRRIGMKFRGCKKAKRRLARKKAQRKTVQRKAAAGPHKTSPGR